MRAVEERHHVLEELLAREGLLQEGVGADVLRVRHVFRRAPLAHDQDGHEPQARVAAEPDATSPSLIRDACEKAFGTYRALLARGVPRELARSVLPVATYSHMFAKVDLRNLFHFLTLRLHQHAQREIQIYAAAMLRLIRPIVPVATSAWEEEFNARTRK